MSLYIRGGGRMRTWYQTDFEGIIKRDGCLVFSIIDMCNDYLTSIGHVPKSLDKVHVEKMLEHAHERGYIQKSADDHAFGMYVLDHSGLANEVLSWLIEPDIRCKYIGAFYLDNRQSWGHKHGSNGMILQVQTPNGGHFRRLGYDPWELGTDALFLRSVRYYKFYREAAA
jgi:hypothetical protein